MKHIGFDESTVLGEYARIANEQGLIKQAIDPGQSVHNFPEDTIEGEIAPPGAQLMEPPAPIEASETAKWFSGVNAKVREKLQSADGLDKTYWAAVQEFLNGQVNPKTFSKPVEQLQQELQSAAPRGLGSGPKEFMAMVGGRPMPMMLGQRADDLDVEASKELDNVRQAEGQIYDVSGETGEQLVDSAHPGGGTKTELTHSKTDENLVETIVEQQVKDIEVAKSVPKGTYAALFTLYTKLSKMGHEKHLGALKETIKSLATAEDVVSLHLTSLADRLDSIGSKNAANRVDQLMKKSFGPAMMGAGAAGAAWLGKYLYDNYLGPVKGSIEAVIDRLGDLDPRDDTATRTIASWTQELQTMLQSVGIPPLTNTKEEAKDAAAKKHQELSQVANKLGQMQSQFPSLQFSDMGSDVQEAATALAGAVQSVQGRVQTLAQEYPSLAKKIDEDPNAVDTDGDGKPDSSMPPEEGEKKPEAKKTVFNDWNRARRFAKRFNTALRDLEDEHRNVIRFDPAAKKTKTISKMMRKDMRRALQRIREAGGWKTFESDMDKLRAGGAGEGVASTGPETEGRIVGDKSTEDVEKYQAKLGEVANKMVQHGWRQLDAWADIPKSQLSIADAKLYQKELRNMSIAILREVAPYGADVEVPQWNAEMARGLAEQLKAKVVERWKQKG